MSAIARQLAALDQRIKIAADRAGRSAASISLTAVSKTHDQDVVRQALIAGQRVFGENRVQEAKAKFTSLRQDYPDLKLHLIGPLQTNKAEDAVRLFDVIETLDRFKLADALAKAIQKTGCKPHFYIEINSGDEPQKAGIAPTQLGGFIDYSRKLGLMIDGLMCIPPQGEDAVPYFRRMQQLADQYALKQLSMGMSGDFEAAIACGATAVRVGTAIFGMREKIDR